MIVKNESKIIQRVLASVLSIVDTYCICDTGSTDNTVELIENFMREAGKPGEVIQEPFKNFGYNRSVALKAADKWGDYALLIDADMKLIITPEFKKENLTADGYQILQKTPGLSYYNTRIVKLGIGVRCLCPTHEYYDFPKEHNRTARLETIYINDIGDGGCKGDKFERDVRLLTEGLKEEPNNGRYHFYLANSYRDLGKLDEAIQNYKRRVEIGGWAEEIYESCYQLGHAYSRKQDMPSAIYWWMEAYNHRPQRAESLYEITKHYRIVGKQRLAQVFCDIALKIPFPKDDVLFIRHRVYDYQLEYEDSVIAYYTKKPIKHYKHLDLLAHSEVSASVLSNYKFYAKKLVGLGAKVMSFADTVEKDVGGRPDTLTCGTPSIIRYGDGYAMNLRYSNYTITPAGEYSFRHSDGKIISINKTCRLTADLERTGEEHWFDETKNNHLRYLGVEDVRLFDDAGTIRYSGVVEHPVKRRVTVGLGVYDLSSHLLDAEAMNSPNDRACEKSWLYFHDASGQTQMVYEWSPLTFCNTRGEITHKQTGVPAFFSMLRGSTNGQRVGDEIWFLCHIVEYSKPRQYYHIIVTIDAQTLAYKRHSIMFKFHGDPIEYALGMVVEDERIIFSYSRWDRNSALMIVSRDRLENELFPGFAEGKSLG